MLKPVEVYNTLMSNSTLIDAGTMLVFSGDLYHAGPRNPHKWNRNVMFMDTYIQQYGKEEDSQIHPMMVGISKFLSLDKNKRTQEKADFYKFLVECEELYEGKKDSPKVTDFIIWQGGLTIQEYNNYKAREKRHLAAISK